MPKRIIGARLRKLKNPVEPKGYVRELMYEGKGERPELLHQVFSPPTKGVGKIEIMQGKGIVASLTFRYGKDLAAKPAEVRQNDIYIDSGALDAIRVGTAYQKQGMASQLLSEMIHYAQVKKTSNIYLRVNAANTSALKLYTKFGFKFVKSLNANQQLLAYYIV